MCCYTKKKPAYADDHRFLGVYTKAVSLHETQMSPFASDIYKRACSIYNVNKAMGVAYEIVDSYNAHGFTAQESNVLFLTTYGQSMSRIAGLLNLSPRTIESHINNLKNKTGLRSKEQLIQYAIFTRLAQRIPIDLIFKKTYSVR